MFTAVFNILILVLFIAYISIIITLKNNLNNKNSFEIRYILETKFQKNCFYFILKKRIIFENPFINFLSVDDEMFVTKDIDEIYNYLEKNGLLIKKHNL